MVRLAWLPIAAAAAMQLLVGQARALDFEPVTIIDLRPGLSFWTTYGTLNGGTGGLAGGTIGPFLHPCGQTSRDGRFFIADSGSDGASPAVYVYRRDQAKLNLQLVKKIAIPGAGKPTATCRLAATRGFLYLAIGRTPTARVIDLATLTRVGRTPDGGAAINSITASPDYAVISQGQFFTLYTDRNLAFISGGLFGTMIVPDDN